MDQVVVVSCPVREIGRLETQWLGPVSDSNSDSLVDVGVEEVEKKNIHMRGASAKDSDQSIKLKSDHHSLIDQR
jgi:hypothetical protein